MQYSFDKYSYHYKTLLQLGTPLIVGQVGTIVLGFADTLMVGRHSVEELAAASFVNTIMAIVLVFALGFSYGLTPMVGQLYGKGDTESIGGVVKNGLLAATTTALLILAALFAVYINIDRMRQPVELLPLMRPYMIVNMVSMPFVCWFNTFKQFFEAVGDTKAPMYVILAGNVANILGNYVLIYGTPFTPEMGLLGAGLSTMASRMLMCAGMGAMFFMERRSREFSQATLRAKVSRRMFAVINRQSWPVALQMGIESSAFALTGVMAGWLGATVLATHQILVTVSQIFFMVYYGITSAVSVRVSFYVGQGDFGRLRQVTAAGFHIVLLIACSISVPVFLLRNNIGYLFTDSDEVAQLCAGIIYIMVLYQFGDGMQMTYAGALRGTANVKPMMYIALVSYFVVSLPLSFLLGIHMGYGMTGIWTAFPVSLTIAALLYYYFFNKRVARLEAGAKPRAAKQA